MGHFVNIRGPIGEGHSLLDNTIAAERRALFEEAQQEALLLGPPGSHVPLDLNQVTHQLRFADGQEGPDALQIIHDIPGQVGIWKAPFQVKVADDSEGVKQVVGDAFRSVGLLKQGGPVSPVLIFKGPGQLEEVRLPLVVDPRVSRRAMVVNALDSTTPLRDRLELDLLGIPVDERKSLLTVAQFNHVTLPVLQSALAHLQKAGKLK